MRYKVVIKTYKDPPHLIIELSDGRRLKGPVINFPKYMSVGSTGKVVQGKNGLRFVPDAIDAD